MRIAGWLSEIVIAVLAAGALGGSAHDARADPAPDPQIAKADALFAEGKALLASNLTQACSKFRASLQYNAAAIGTLLNVALCDEKAGDVASAVAKFSEARDRAKEQGLIEHVRAAEEHILALEPSVPHVAITLSETLPETTILIDDKIVALDAIANVAVDPGERVIVVTAPSRLPYRTTLVFAKAEHKDVTIPALARSVTVHSSQLRIGQITTIIGGAAAGTGLGIGLYALHLYNQQFGHMKPGDGLCDKRLGTCEAHGQTATQRAHTLGNVGTAVGVAGLAAASVGVYLWIRAPASTSSDGADRRLVVVPAITAGSLTVAALGRF